MSGVQNGAFEVNEVYVVSSGTYSDYGIVGIFDDFELAQKANASTCEANEIETYPINPDADKYRQGLWPFFVEMKKNGDVVDVGKEKRDSNYIADWGSPGEHIFRAAIWARDEKHAIKIANERRGYILAMNMWPEKGYASMDLWGED